MLGALDGVLAGYNFDRGGLAPQWVGLLFTCFGCAMLWTSLILTALHPSPAVAANSEVELKVHRWLWCFYVVQIVREALTMTVYGAVLQPEIEPAGHAINIVLWAAGAAASWHVCGNL